MSNSSFLLSLSSSIAKRVCLCGVKAEIKTSWTQLNTGRRFFCCKTSKMRGGCNYFDWCDDKMPPQEKRVMWGLLKKVKSFDEEKNRSRKLIVICVGEIVILARWNFFKKCS
ncbi:uncharacterized protein LOC124887123 [Capsicum annuum]|uniref:uncharacterized protein LOC124887123 n=1 Tax=Capsicum annuum TaxID=4072 RepID=UPI001FB0C698|nr:uncharacterized protein LOC124887123 [Capsicum annuum]